MNKTLTTSLAAIGLAGAGVIGVGAIASAQYGGDDPTIDDEVVEDTGDTPAPQGLVGDNADGEPGEPGEGRRGHRGRHANPEVVAEALGITTEELSGFREQGMSVADIATEVGVSVDAVSAAILADVETHLAEKVAEGELTQEEADEKLANAAERIDDKITAVPGERDGGRRGFRGNSETVTDALGVTDDELRDFREQGLSLAEVAEQQGVDVDTLVDAIVADAETHLAEKVAEGDLTQEEADEKLADAEERVTERVNSEPGERGERGERGGRRGPGGPGGGDAPADA